MTDKQLDKKFTLEYIKEVVNTKELVLLYFESKTCGVCTVIKEKLQELLIKYPDINPYYMEVEEYKDIAAYYNFFTVPGILIFIQGKETIREARMISIQDIDSKLSRYNKMLQEEIQ